MKINHPSGFDKTNPNKPNLSKPLLSVVEGTSSLACARYNLDKLYAGWQSRRVLIGETLSTAFYFYIGAKKIIGGQ